MKSLPDFRPADQTPSTIRAGVVVLAFQYLREAGIQTGPISAATAALGVSRSQAYELADRIHENLSTLARPGGRPPPSPKAPEHEDAPYAVACAVRDFLTLHPGAIVSHQKRQAYSDELRRMVVGLRNEGGSGHGLSLARFAQASGVPLETLRQWLNTDLSSPPTDADAGPVAASTVPLYEAIKSDELPQGVIAQVIELWRRHRGMNLTTFARLLYNQHRLEITIGTLREILRLGEGQPRSKPKRTKPDAEAIRGQLERFFPGAQWMADGKKLTFRLGDRKFAFNWELAVDSATGALIGFDLSDTEDSASLCCAFDHGVDTTSAPPLALLSDNLPANHSEESRAHLDANNTLDMPSTRYRPENKATVEGSFGLFEQQAPPMEVPDTKPREMARQILALVLTVYCIGRNLVPRKGLGTKSAAQVYQEASPSEEDKAQALQRLTEIKARIENRRQRDNERMDPVAREAIEVAFKEFDMKDPEGHFLRAIAKTGIDAILEAIAVFRVKRQRGQEVEQPERYFLGIARNIVERNDERAIYSNLIELRKKARDQLMAPLLQDEQQLCHNLDLFKYVDETLERALACDASIDRTFWRRRFLKALTNLPRPKRDSTIEIAVNKIACSFRLKSDERQAFIAELATLRVPFAA